MAYDHEAMQKHLEAMFGPQGLGVRIGTGKKDSDGNGISEHVPAKVWLFNEQVLRHTISLGLARWHGQHLNAVPTDGGAKLEAFRAMLAQAHDGETPQEFVGKRRGRAAAAVKTPHDEAVMFFVNDSVARLIAQLEPLVAKGAIKVDGSGKNGKMLAKDWPKAAAQVGKLAPMVKDGDWDWAALRDHVTTNKPDEIAAKAAEIQEARDAAAAMAQEAESVDLDAVDFDF